MVVTHTGVVGLLIHTPRFPESVIKALLFCIIFPVVPSNRTIALSVDDAGHITHVFNVCLFIQFAMLFLVYEN